MKKTPHAELRLLTTFQWWLATNYKNLPADSGNLTKRAREFYKEYNFTLVPEEEKHKIGDKYRHKDTQEVYVLALVDDGGSAVMINIQSGFKYSEPAIIQDPYRITSEEFYYIADRESDCFIKITTKKLKK